MEFTSVCIPVRRPQPLKRKALILEIKINSICSCPLLLFGATEVSVLGKLLRLNLWLQISSLCMKNALNFNNSFSKFNLLSFSFCCFSLDAG